MVKEVQELKVSIENISYSRSQVQTALEDSRRRLEEEDRRRSTLESSLHSIELELESCRVQLEEESESRLEIERQFSKASADVNMYKSKYESECASRVEELEEVRWGIQKKIRINKSFHISFNIHLETLCAFDDYN